MPPPPLLLLLLLLVQTINFTHYRSPAMTSISGCRTTIELHHSVIRLASCSEFFPLCCFC
jgi:hypothetical protein